jgi:hypothetical protein
MWGKWGRQESKYTCLEVQKWHQLKYEQEWTGADQCEQFYKRVFPIAHISQDLIFKKLHIEM